MWWQTCKYKLTENEKSDVASRRISEYVIRSRSAHPTTYVNGKPFRRKYLLITKIGLLSLKPLF